ncbi:hypothetical protein AVEN_226033-1 [Araneus ventricosus]|uniref:Uncharacterized protein n=1 Tax=Araneus ventricosus TaxID=182803 RepID=A0A4Y2HQK0_ARAVE|nr:hypothetical protein AVEN_226033-1 [Araneus ventricosus]
MTQVPILVCSNLALQMCSKFDTARAQASYCKRQSHQTSNLQQAWCVNLIANYSNPDSNPPQAASLTCHLSQSASGILTGEDRLR